ncbi:MAG: flagellar hook-length control protein FliK [Lachnospiraceae bacterium]|nr:flagellar hook-length control protein FliK [Lachnospiraceae bacterium]
MLVQNTQSADVSGIFSVSKDLIGSKVAEKAGKAFESLMSSYAGKNGKTFMAVSASVTATKTTTQKADTTANANDANSTADTTKAQASPNTDDAEKVIANNGTGTENTGKTDGNEKLNAKETTAIGDAEEETGLSEEELEAVGSFMMTLTVIIVEWFGISEEQLQDAFGELGIGLSDLSSADKLSDLFAYFNLDGDVTRLFTDNSQLDSFNELLEKVQDLFEGIMNDLTEVETPEDLAKLIDEAQTRIEETFNTKAEANTAVNEGTKQKGIEVKSDENLKVEAETVNENAETQTITVTRENSAGSNTRDTKKDGSENRGDSQFSAFVNNIEKAAESFKIDDISLISPNADLQKIAEQIIDQIKINVNKANTSIEMQLTPEALGKVKVTVEENGGVLTAKFQTENHIAREAIEANLVQFKESLAEKGLKVENIEVAVADFRFDENNGGAKEESQGQSKRRKNLGGIEEVNSVDNTVSIDMVSQSYIDNGTSTVSYSA